MPVLILIVIGAAAGLIATKVMKLDASLPVTIAIGVLGALIGGMVLRGLMTVGAAGGGVVGAILGAMLLIWLWRRYIRHWF